MRSLIIITAFIAAFVSGCRKSDNPRVPDLVRVPMPHLAKDTSADQIIFYDKPTEFVGRFKVDMMWKEEVAPASIDIVMIRNGDKSNVLKVLEDVTSFPVDIEVTGPQLAEAFGEEIVRGDKYEFGADITLEDGTVIPAFSPTGETYGTGVYNQPGVSPFISYEAACSFVAAEYAGNFVVEVDEWGDYAEGTTIIPVTVIDDETVSFKYATTNSQPIIVKVNLANNATSVAPQVYGDYPQFGIEQIMAESVANNPANFVSPCDGVLSVRLRHFDAIGAYGNFTIRLKKVD